MDSLTLVVLSPPNDPELAMLKRLPPETRILIGDSPEAFDSQASGADAILAWATRREIAERVWPKTPHVRWVHSASAGLENLLFPALIESSVVVTNSRGTFSWSLGEYVLAAILHFAKNVRRLMRSQAAGVWDVFDVEAVRGRTLGIVGYGDIGRAIAERARVFGMRVLASRRRPEASAGDPLVDAVYPATALREMMALCDYVAVAAPLTEDTRGLVGAAEIAAMKPTAVLINVGRGPVIDESALVRALAEGRIRGAALDVFEQEPLPAGHPFYRMENVLLSAHCADHTAGWRASAMEVFLDNFERFRQGQPLLNIVDKRRGY
jgi:phosphoglycerate dehydrogenase-like enzyme